MRADRLSVPGATVSHRDLIFLNAVRGERRFFAANGEVENDREARNPPSAARNIAELGRRQQPQSAGAARARLGKNVLAMSCHRQSGESPHAGAPAFRALDGRVDLDSFMERLREGLMVGHPDMPTFRFTREDARAFLVYLRSIQAP